MPHLGNKHEHFSQKKTNKKNVLITLTEKTQEIQLQPHFAAELAN